MATATIIATDHHQFWVDSKGAWINLENVQPGDTLLTPDGVTTVNTVTEYPAAETLVWELDTNGPDTFTVWTGTGDVLVHNSCLEALKEWKSKKYRFGDQNFLLDKKE